MSSGKVRYTNCSSSGVEIGGVTYNGLFIYPDNYSGDEVSSSSTWDDINAAGIVFLPGVGYRRVRSVYGVVTNGYYWSSTAYDSTYGYHLRFDNYVNPTYYDCRYNGYSVRLVCPRR